MDTASAQSACLQIWLLLPVLPWVSCLKSWMGWGAQGGCSLLGSLSQPAWQSAAAAAFWQTLPCVLVRLRVFLRVTDNVIWVVPPQKQTISTATISYCLITATPQRAKERQRSSHASSETWLAKPRFLTPARLTRKPAAPMCWKNTCHKWSLGQGYPGRGIYTRYTKNILVSDLKNRVYR